MLAMGYVILLLSEDKQITRITPDNLRSKLDPYVFQDRLGTPYLVLIPPASQAAQHQDILVSQSTLYGPLCLLRDLLRGGGLKAPPFFRRHTSLSPALALAGSLPGPARGFLLELAREKRVQFEAELIERVLESTRSARLRDLPAYLLVSQKLQRAITKYAALPAPEKGLLQEGILMIEGLV
jgi:hypothetical protein